MGPVGAHRQSASQEHPAAISEAAVGPVAARFTLSLGQDNAPSCSLPQWNVSALYECAGLF